MGRAVLLLGAKVALLLSGLALATACTVGDGETWFPQAAPGQQVRVLSATPEATRYTVTKTNGDTYDCNRTAPTFTANARLTCTLKGNR